MYYLRDKFIKNLIKEYNKNVRSQMEYYIEMTSGVY